MAMRYRTGLVLARETTVSKLHLRLQVLSGTAGLLDKYLRYEEDFNSARDRLSNDLHELIGQTCAGHRRAALITIRRDIHRFQVHQRRPRIPQHVLPAHMYVDHLRICELASNLSSIKTSIDRSFRVEIDQAFRSLKQAYSVAHLRRAVRSSAPHLLNHIDRWDPATGNAKIPKLIRAAKFLTRATTKTSPYNTLLVTSGPGRTAAGCEAVWMVAEQLGGVLDMDTRSTDAHVFGRSGQFNYRVNPTLMRLNPTTYQLVRSDGIMNDVLVKVRVSGWIEELIQVLAQGASPIHDHDALNELIRRQPRRVLTYPIGEDEVTDCIDRLRLSGVLLRSIPNPKRLASKSHYQDTRLNIALSNHSSRGERLTSSLYAVSGLMEATDTDSQHGVDIHTLGPSECRIDESAVAASGPRTETSHIQPDRAHLISLKNPSELISLHPHEIDALSTYCQFLAVFDVDLPARLAIASWFRAKYKPDAQIPVIQLFADLHGHDESGQVSYIKQLVKPTPPNEANRSTFPILQELDELRLAARTTLARAAGQPYREALLLLRRSLEQWPRWLKAPDTYGCYIHVSPTNNCSREIVLNAFHDAHGKTGGRFKAMLDAANLTSHLEAAEIAPADPGEITASIFAGLHPLNNVTTSTSYVLDMPGMHVETTKQCAHIIKLNELTTFKDPESGLLQLWSDRHGSRIRPLHEGSMSPYLLSPLNRLLTLLFSRQQAFTAKQLPYFGAIDDGGYTPRLTIGPIVVQRARTVFNSSSAPQWQNAKRESDQLLDFERWRRTSNLPVAFFAKPFGEDAAVGAAGQKHLKPMYIDTRNWLHIRILQDLLRRHSSMCAEEVLPDISHGGPKITEYYIELLSTSSRVKQ